MGKADPCGMNRAARGRGGRQRVIMGGFDGHGPAFARLAMVDSQTYRLGPPTSSQPLLTAQHSYVMTTGPDLVCRCRCPRSSLVKPGHDGERRVDVKASVTHDDDQDRHRQFL